MAYSDLEQRSIMPRGRAGYIKRRPRYTKRRRSPGLRSAINAAAKMAGAIPGHLWDSAGRKWLAEGLGIKVQSLNHWEDIPRDRIMMVHVLTKIPLSELAPDLFK